MVRNKEPNKQFLCKNNSLDFYLVASKRKNGSCLGYNMKMQKTITVKNKNKSNLLNCCPKVLTTLCRQFRSKK